MIAMVFVLRMVLEISHDLLNTDEEAIISFVVFLFIWDVAGIVVVKMMISSIVLVLVMDRINMGGIFWMVANIMNWFHSEFFLMLMNQECRGEAPIFMHLVSRMMMLLWFSILFMLSDWMAVMRMMADAEI